MKNLIAILLIICTVNGAYAGNGNSTQQDLVDRFSQKMANKPNAMARINAFSRIVYGSVAGNKTDATGQRIMGLRVNQYTSGAWVLSDSATYTYTGNNGHPHPTNSRYTTKLDYKWTSGALGNERRITRTFNANNRQASVVSEVWTGGGYETSGRTLFTYDQYGYLASMLSQEWDGTAWENASRDSFVNRPDGQVVYDAYEYWDGSSWVFDYRFTTWYTPAGLLDSMLSEFWEVGVFDVMYEHKWIFNGSGQLINEMAKYHGDYDDEYGHYTYDANGNEILHLIQDWDGSTWQDRQRFTSEYNGADQQTLSLSEVIKSGVWTPSLRYTWDYNGNGYLSENTTEQWDSASAAWEGYQKDMHTYDANNNPDVKTTQTWAVGAWVNSTRTDTDYNLAFNNMDYSLTENWVSGNWENSKEEFRYYETHEVSGVAPVSSAGIKVYPNPASSLLMVDIRAGEGETVLEVYNISGQQVLSANATGEHHQLNIETLGKGLYFLQVTQGSSISHSRFVKE